MLTFRDIAVVASCLFVFAATVALTAAKEHRHPVTEGPHAGMPGGPPVTRIARALDIPADRLRAAFEKVGPPSEPAAGPPSEQELALHSRRLAAVLNVPVERLRSVMETYRPPERPD
jgi:hypothetical protein